MKSTFRLAQSLILTKYENIKFLHCNREGICREPNLFQSGKAVVVLIRNEEVELYVHLQNNHCLEDVEVER